MPTTGLQIVVVSSGQHQTLSKLFDTTYEDAWKVLFKGAEAPASATDDHGFISRRQANEVSCSTLYGTLVFHSLTLCGIKSPLPLTGLAEDVGAGEGRPNWGGRRVPEGENPPAGLYLRCRRRRGGMAIQGQAPGKIVSVRLPE